MIVWLNTYIRTCKSCTPIRPFHILFEVKCNNHIQKTESPLTRWPLNWPSSARECLEFMQYMYWKQRKYYIFYFSYWTIFAFGKRYGPIQLGPIIKTQFFIRHQENKDKWIMRSMHSKNISCTQQYAAKSDNKNRINTVTYKHQVIHKDSTGLNLSSVERGNVRHFITTKNNYFSFVNKNQFGGSLCVCVCWDSICKKYFLFSFINNLFKDLCDRTRTEKIKTTCF